MPANQFGSACSIRKPMQMNRIPIMTGIVRLGLTCVPIPQRMICSWIKKKNRKSEDEPLVITLKFQVIFPEGIDPWENCKQSGKPGHERGNDNEAPEFRKLTVHTTGCIPVGRDRIWHMRVDEERNRKGQNEYANDGNPDKTHAAFSLRLL
jgi:hypothetical protein